MADGDERIDHNDRVPVLNRLTDGTVDVVYDGKTITWQPGEVRSIERISAHDHFIRNSRVRVDPTGENPGVYKLVIVGADKVPLYPGDSAEPLTEAYCKELEKYGFLDTTHLSPDRQFGGDHSMQLIDPESGQHPTKLALRGTPPEGPIPQAAARPLAPRVDPSALDSL